MRVFAFPGWWQVVAAMIVQAVSTASIYTSYSVIAASLQSAFEPSRMVLMLGMTATALASGLLSPSLGKAIDRYSIRRLMLIGTGFITTGFLLLSLATSMTQVIFVYFLFMSVGIVLLGPVASSALLARWFSRRRGFAMGIAASGTAIGGLLIPPLLQGLIDFFEWRLALRIFGGIIFVVATLVISFLVINKPADRNLNPDGDIAPVVISEGRVEAASLSTASLFASGNFWLIALTLSLVFSCSTAISSNLIPFVLDKNIAASQGALLISIISGAGLAGKLLCAGLVDRIDFRWVFASMLSALCVAMFSFLHAQSYTMLAVSCFIMGISSGGALPLWGALLARIYGPDNIGRVMGLMTFIITPGTVLSPPLLGLIFDRTRSYDYAFVMYIALLIVAMVFVPRIRAGREKAEPVRAVG